MSNFSKGVLSSAISITLLFGVVFPWVGQSCTTLSLMDAAGEHVFGKAFDWFDSHGMVFVNKRNVQKEAMLFSAGTPLTWTSQFGSVTFNQQGRDFPLGGMNEAGMVMEIMTGPVQDRADAPGLLSVNEVQIIQYVLDSFSNIAEVVAGLQNIRIARVSADVHYLVCDSTNACATVEYLAGELVIHSGATLPYHDFTNSSYDDSAVYAAQFEGLGGTRAVPSSDSSDDRFVQAATAVKSYDGQDGVTYVQNFLDQVKLTGVWRISYVGTRAIVFRNVPDLTNTRQVDLNLDFSCATPVLVYDMAGTDTGDITPKFIPYTTALNASNVNPNTMLPDDLKAQIITYPETNTKCLTQTP